MKRPYNGAMPNSPWRLDLGESAQRWGALLARGWSLPSADESPLGRLQGRRLGRLRLVVLLGPKNSVGARYFQLFLLDPDGCLSEEPIALGLHSSGRFPAYNWIELARYQGEPSLHGRTLSLARRGLDRRLFRALSSLVPPGGHLMVEYESASQRQSERILSLGCPAAASPLGYLLLCAGCLSFRNWYFPEGGREGPRKLQGFKPLDSQQARRWAEALHRELTAFLSQPARPKRSPWAEVAGRLAHSALRVLETLV